MQRATIGRLEAGIGSYGGQSWHGVARGVDTFEGDPMSGFSPKSADALRLGQDLAGAGLPTESEFGGE